MGHKKARRKQTGRRRSPPTHARPVKSALEAVVDVVMPIYGEFERAERALQALEKSNGDHRLRLYLVDDASESPFSRSVNMKEFKRFERVWMRRNSENLGFVQTANRGAESGNGHLILFLNTDVELEPEALNAMVQEFEDPAVGIVGIKLVFPLDSRDTSRPAGTIQHAGIVVGFDMKPFHVHIGWPPDHSRVNQRREMQLVTGACLMTRRSLWEEVGGFAEVYGRGTFEDTEYCVAVRILGFKIIYQPAAVGYHFVGASAMKNRQGFPVQMNEMIWKIRCGDKIIWDEWRYW